MENVLSQDSRHIEHDWYPHWDSIIPMEGKTKLINTLVCRSLEICFQEKLCCKINKIKTILQQKWMLRRDYHF